MGKSRPIVKGRKLSTKKGELLAVAIKEGHSRRERGRVGVSKGSAPKGGTAFWKWKA